MSCAQFSTTSPACRTVTVIEPDSTFLTSTSAGSTDQSLDEMGSEILEEGQTTATINFQTPKAGTNYRFEFLYIDAFGIPNPGNVEAIPTIQTAYSFTVQLVGAQILDGYILRWRVVVIELGVGGQLDAPETIYIQLPQVNVLTVYLTNPRSATNYQFDALYVENLVDPVDAQTPVFVQVIAKTNVSFTIGINPIPPTDNYFLTARVPIT